MMFVESALVKYQDVLISVSRGGPDSVEFNWDEVWSFRERLGERFDPALLHMCHVHPCGKFLECSPPDRKIVRSWDIAFGYPIAFSIVIFNSPAADDLSHRMKTWRLVDGREQAQEATGLRAADLQILKELSYGRNQESTNIRDGRDRLQSSGADGEDLS
jgi:hypothetical protein